eukprot:COSAG04_NODE_26487_length_294_cov_0.800000_1_plen_97_part_11
MNEEHYGRIIVPDKTRGLTDVLRWQFTVLFRRPPACKRLSLLGLRCSEHDRLQTTFLAGLRPHADSALWCMVQGDNEQPPTADMVRSCWEYTKRSQF